MTWRVLTHDTLTVSLTEMTDAWCVADVVAAHRMLDEIDRVRARSARG